MKMYVKQVAAAQAAKDEAREALLNKDDGIEEQPMIDVDEVKTPSTRHSGLVTRQERLGTGH